MNIFKKFFKKDNYVDLKLTKNIFASTKICTFNELFSAIGADKEIKKMQETNAKQTYHVDNLRINKITSDKVDTFLLTNLLSKKNKYAKHYTEKYLRSQHGFDNLMFAPSIDESVPNDTIRIIKKNHPEYREVAIIND